MPIGSHLVQPASANMRSSDDVQLQRLRRVAWLRSATELHGFARSMPHGQQVLSLSLGISARVCCNLCAFGPPVPLSASLAIQSPGLRRWRNARIADGLECNRIPDSAWRRRAPAAPRETSARMGMRQRGAAVSCRRVEVQAGRGAAESSGMRSRTRHGRPDTSRKRAAGRASA